jgi:hypothetical protein
MSFFPSKFLNSLPLLVYPYISKNLGLCYLLIEIFVEQKLKPKIFKKDRLNTDPYHLPKLKEIVVPVAIVK